MRAADDPCTRRIERQRTYNLGMIFEHELVRYRKGREVVLVIVGWLCVVKLARVFVLGLR